MKINPVNFTFKKDNRKSMGVIAQEIEKIYPQIVFDESDGKHVDYTAIIAPLIESVQELKKENDILKSEINEIKNQQKIKK